MKSTFKKPVPAFCLLFMTLLACGTPETENSETKLIGGTEASPGLFPGVVNLNGCTGAKIGPRTFLTAAHCIVDRSSNVLRAGFRPGASLSVTDSIRLDGTVRWSNVTIERALAHPSYRVADANCGGSCNALGQKSFDVAIVRVNEDTATIPVVNVSYDYIGEGQDAYVMGYGCETSVGGARPDPARLKFQLVSTLAKAALDGSPHVGTKDEVYRHNVLTPGDSYSTANNASICPGDSGGPLLRYVNGRFQVVGVNAYYSFPSGSGVSYTNWHARLSDPYVAWWINGSRAAYSCSTLGSLIYSRASAGQRLKFDLAASKIRSNNAQHSSYGYAEILTPQISGSTVKLPIQVAFSDRNNFDRSRMDNQELWLDRNGTMQLKLVTWGGVMLPVQDLICEENGQVSGVVREGNGVSNIAVSFSL